MTTLPRGHCPRCGSDVALRKGGLVREHEAPRLWNKKTHDWSRVVDTCRGSGKAARGISRARAQTRDTEKGSLLDSASRSPKLTRRGLRALLLRFPVGLVAVIDREVDRRHAIELKRFRWARPPKRVDVIRDLVARALKVDKSGRPTK